MRGISQDRHQGIKYRVNYAYINYNNKTGFYENEIGSSTRQKKQSELNHWKCEKCNNILFVTLKELKLHKTEHHSY
jgi:hypothetical protein